MMQTSGSSILILGCGYLGSRLALKAVQGGASVDILSRNEKVLSEMKKSGVRKAIRSQLETTDWHHQIKPSEYQAIYVTVGSSESTPEGYQKSYIRGLESILEWSRGFAGRLIYTSSISVYGPGNGDWFDETVSPDPSGWRGEIILNSEVLISGHTSAKVTILRLGGIYGPGRDRFLKSAPTDKPRDYYLNLIHVEDAASAMLRCAKTQIELNQCYNLTDNHPFKRQELDQFVAQNDPIGQQGVFSNQHRATPANRRICSMRIQTDLDWQPSYPSVFAAFKDLA